MSDERSTIGSSISREGCAIAVFVFIGPPTGALGVLIAILPGVLGALWSPEAAVFWTGAYLFGTIPTLLTGLAYAALPYELKNPIVSAAVGAFVSFLCGAVIGGFSAAPVFALAGGAAGLVCGLIIMDWRVLWA